MRDSSGLGTAGAPAATTAREVPGPPRRGDADAGRPPQQKLKLQDIKRRRSGEELQDIKGRRGGGDIQAEASADADGPSSVRPSTLMTGAALRANDLMTSSADVLETREELAHLDALKHRIRAASYGMFGQDWGALFRKFDADGSGELDVDEFTAALRGHGEAASLSQDDLVDLFYRIDKDDSGAISASEFREFMAITPEERLRKKARDANGQGTQEYIVLARAVLRAGPSLRSKKVGTLRKGEVIAALEIRGNRMQCSRLRFSSSDSTQVGWCSLTMNADEDAVPEPLLSMLERGEGALGSSGCPRWESEETQLRLQMLGQDRSRAAAARRDKRRHSKRASSTGSLTSQSSCSDPDLYVCDFSARTGSWVTMSSVDLLPDGNIVQPGRSRRQARNAASMLAPLCAKESPPPRTSCAPPAVKLPRGNVSTDTSGSEGELDGYGHASSAKAYTRIDIALKHWQRRRASGLVETASKSYQLVQVQ